MPSAKITSKGQVTIPIEDERRLGSRKATCSPSRSGPTTWWSGGEPTGAEVAAQLDAEAPFRLPSEMTEDEAISRYFEDDWSPGWGPELYVIGGKAPKE